MLLLGLVLLVEVAALGGADPDPPPNLAAKARWLLVISSFTAEVVLWGWRRYL